MMTSKKMMWINCFAFIGVASFAWLAQAKVLDKVKCANPEKNGIRNHKCAVDLCDSRNGHLPEIYELASGANPRWALEAIARVIEDKTENKNKIVPPTGMDPSNITPSSGWTLIQNKNGSQFFYRFPLDEKNLKMKCTVAEWLDLQDEADY